MTFSDGIIRVSTTPTGDPAEATLNVETGWTSSDPALLEFLNTAFPYPDNPTLDFRPQNPNPMYDLMLQTVKLMGAEIIQQPEDDSPEGTVF